MKKTTNKPKKQPKPFIKVIDLGQDITDLMDKFSSENKEFVIRGFVLDKNDQ